MRSLLYITVAIASLAGCTTPKPSAYSCPDWSSSPTHNYSNADFSNFGCASYNNLAVQVTNPADLQSGHGQATGDGDRESAIIQKYMTATPQTPPVISATSSSSSSGR